MKFICKEKRKYVVLIILLVTVLMTLGTSNSYAAINGTPSNTSTTLPSIISTIMSNITVGVIGSLIAPLINLFSVIIFIILYLLAVSFGGNQNNLAFPFPDQIIYNKIPLLDPNFLNPDAGAIGAKVKVILSQTYDSFFVLAGAIFLVAAMIIGVKLVFSTLAAEKAQYKKSLNVWVTGIVMLFVIHYLLAGMFYLNEEIVKELSAVSDKVKFPVDFGSTLSNLGATIGVALAPVTGGTSLLLGGAIKVVGGFLGDVMQLDTTIEMTGYSGLLVMFVVDGILGTNIISSIVCLIILGQSFALFISYFKRAISCIILGVLAPIVIAIDVVQKSFR